MSSSAVPHVVAFLTRPLLAAFPFAVVSSAQLILSASLASQPSATYTLKAASTPPAPLLAASIGAGIPWAAWLAALGSDDILLFYGPGYVKARLGDATVTDVWSEETQGSVVPIARLAGPHPSRAQPPAAAEHQHAPARRPPVCARARLPEAPGSRRRRRADPHPEPALLIALRLGLLFRLGLGVGLLLRLGLLRLVAAATATKPTLKASPIKASPKAPAPRPAPVPAPAKKDTTAYMYQGGVTRVMTGGVMLGPRHVGVVRATRS
ncbi:hypothetical protein B0H14DRAFT_3141533 [Mycena olivaceomarginata]|nr:hypothetical protein B0H14DRAFT_3141533 [Mycena olivaceomarginata]